MTFAHQEFKGSNGSLTHPNSDGPGGVNWNAGLSHSTTNPFIPKLR
jgi:hypothetical protein